MSTPSLPLAPAGAAPSLATSDAERRHLAARVRLLSWASLGYMTLEGGVAILAGILAGSIALIGFGIDSAIEGFASAIIVWRFTGQRIFSDAAETRAQRLVAIQFFILAPYVGFESVSALIEGERPDVSWLGIVLSASSVVVMPCLGIAKQRLADRLGSAATKGEGRQNMLCAYLAGALLVGLLSNAAFGAWWLDPTVGLLIAAVAVKEGLEAWRGEGCCVPTAAGSDADACSGDCRTTTPTTDLLAIAECRLDIAGLRSQADRYRQLGATATAVDRRRGRLTVTFGPALDEPLLSETLAVERDCCAFFGFHYQPAARRLSITVEQAEQEPALDALHFAITGHETTNTIAAAEPPPPQARVRTDSRARERRPA